MTKRTWLLAAACSLALGVTPALAASNGGSEGGGNNNRTTAGTTPSNEVMPGTATSPQGANPATGTALKKQNVPDQTAEGGDNGTATGKTTTTAQ